MEFFALPLPWKFNPDFLGLAIFILLSFYPFDYLTDLLSFQIAENGYRNQ